MEENNNNINELSDMVPLDRIGAIKTLKKSGIHPY